MTEIVQQPVADAAVTASGDGYLTVAYPYQGHVYTFRFYEGFARRVVLRPRGGAPVEIYQQQGVYYVPQDDPSHLKGPDVRSTISVSGGPDNLDIELEVDDGPQDADFKGPIKKIKVRARRERGQGNGQARSKGQGPSVTVLRGEEQVEAVVVEMKPGHSASRGGVDAFQTTLPGDEVEVENNASTCPPYCPKKTTTP